MQVTQNYSKKWYSVISLKYVSKAPITALYVASNYFPDFQFP